jgi:glycosyltransferase involved in cell wall biosynthesis
MGGYPRYSVLVQRYLARTLTCSQYMKDWLLERGHLDADRIGVVKLGIEASHFVPATPSRRHAMKETLLGVDPETVVITFVGRLDPQKRPLLVPRIANELIERIPDLEVVFVMLGDGEERHDLEEIIKSYDLDDIVRVEGLERDPAQYYAASDIFLLPSVNEGISIAVAEAMAMGLPIVTARTGALPEQLGEVVAAGKRTTLAQDLGGILVDHVLDTAKDTILYADALEKILLDPALRNRLGRNARKLANDELDWRITLSALFHETELAENLPGHGDTALLGYPHPAAEMAIQSLLIDAWKETDQVGYCKSHVRGSRSLCISA